MAVVASVQVEEAIEMEWEPDEEEAAEASFNGLLCSIRQVHRAYAPRFMCRAACKNPGVPAGPPRHKRHSCSTSS